MSSTTIVKNMSNKLGKLPWISCGSYQSAAVASGDSRCNKIGTDILARGGSAADAVIATALCIGVVTPHYCGLGGGFFATIYDNSRKEVEKQKRVQTLISRETAPIRSTGNMFADSSLSPTKGGCSIAVPGQIAGFHKLHQRWGKLPWKDLFQPAIKLAEEMTVSENFADTCKAQVNNLEKYKNLRSTYLKDGQLYKEGDIFRDLQLAHTLKVIANGGVTAFYEGSLSQDIVDDISEQGGIITLDDLRNYTPVFKDPSEVTLLNGELTAYGPPPPSTAAVLLLILRILDGYKMHSKTPEDLRYHRMIEAIKFGFAKGSSLGDADFINTTYKLVDDLTSESSAQRYRKLIHDSRTFPLHYYEPEFDILRDSGTSHISIQSPDGSAISLTTSLNSYFGSKVRGSRTGIVFNNHMSNFSLPGSENQFGLRSSFNNSIQPGKRPLSNMSPLILVGKNGIPRLILGAAGATRCITSIAQVVFNFLYMKKPIDKALAEPRVHHELIPEKLYYEEGVSEKVLAGLKSRGHVLEKGISHRWFGTAHGIQIDSRESCYNGLDMNKDVNCIKPATDWRLNQKSRQSPKVYGF